MRVTVHRTIILTLGVVCMACFASGCSGGDDDGGDGGPTFSVAQLHEACAVLDTCWDQNSGGVAYAYCIESYWWTNAMGSDPTQLDPFIRCLLQSATCLDAVQCLQGGCTAPAACNGDVLNMCYWEIPLQIDCAADGAHCAVDPYTYQPWCRMGTAGDTCTAAEDQENWCMGTVRALCQNEVLYLEDCADSLPNGACADGGSFPICTVGPVTDCDEFSFVDRCEGHMKVSCFEGHVRYEDCRRYLGNGDATCELLDGSSECVVPGSSCQGVLEYQSCQCHGNELWCCLMGNVQTFDCAPRGASPASTTAAPTTAPTAALELS
jgi:hypothetical protein